VALVLTGAGTDGARGAVKVKQRGGLIVVQEPATAESGAMPAAALAATRVDRILPLPQIASFLVGLCASTESQQNA
jgi:two-component system chemotaxis response regulator CheB